MLDVENHKKHQIVYFHQHGAKIFNAVGNIDHYKDKPNVLIDPDFTPVKGRPPHHWSSLNGELGLLTVDECNKRDEFHSQNPEFKNPEIIEVPVDRIVEKTIERVKLVNKEVPRLVQIKYMPKWIYFTHTFLIIIIILLITMKGQT